MKRFLRWLIILLVLALLGAGLFLGRNTRIGRTLLARVTGEQANRATTATVAANATDDEQAATIQIQPASTILQEVSASGHIALTQKRAVALGVDGVVSQVMVKVGDVVTAGQVLVTLDITDLERSLRRAKLSVEAQQTKRALQMQAASEAEIAIAEANLQSAQADLAEAQAGPSQQALGAARSNLAAAWAKYNDLNGGPSQNSLTQLSADMQTKQIAVAEAQRAYDRVKWRNDVGMTSEAAALQKATIAYESALAAYQEKVQPAATGDLQSALSNAQNAQKQLDDLLKEPSAATIAAAAAKVVDAQAKLDELKIGPDELDLQEINISLEQALIDLEEAMSNLEKARVTAPIAGTVLAINAEIGERAGRGSVVVTLVDTTQLELTIDVAEVDIRQITVGQEAAVLIDAFPGQTFAGQVAYIAPASSATSGLINYPVTVRLTAADLNGVRGGMTAVANIINTNSAAPNSWLVPSTAIQQQGGSAVVTVVRNAISSPIAVTPGAIQGEWTIVQSPELQAGDQVIGSVVTKIDNTQVRFGPGGGGPGGGGGPPPGP